MQLNRFKAALVRGKLQKKESLKAYKTAKHCTVVRNMSKDSIALESHHRGNHFVFHCNDCKAKRVEIWRSHVSSTYALVRM